MKITVEQLFPLIITVAGGLLLWTLKIAINAVARSLTRQLREEMDRIKAEKDAMQRQIDVNTRRIDFLIEKLIERNS